MSIYEQEQPPRLIVLAANTLLSVIDERSITSSFLQTLPERIVLLLLALLIRKLRLNFNLAYAFAHSGHSLVEAEIAQLDIYRGLLLGGLSESCRE